ncbi:MAG: quinolinate synthase NadA [Clostridiales bacterium]|nr:quinolinate synthase NadA [Clostridiales bacterium]
MIIFEKLCQNIRKTKLPEDMMDIKDKIRKLKKERNAVILSHYYQHIEVQEIADFIGDSFELAKKAKEAKEDVIVFCGVYFMAEGAKILNPTKTVLLPVKEAGCPMADMVTAEDVMELRKKYPDAAVVTYVNSTAEVKAVSDICCTSSSAVRIVNSIPNKRIIFVPDENLGRYIAKQVPDKEIIPYSGYCQVHQRVTVQDVEAVRKAMPDALLLVHPECVPEVVEKADFVGSTTQIINKALESKNKDIIIGTEVGVVDFLKKKTSDKNFYLLSPKMICANMKKTSLKDVLNSLENNVHEIEIEQEIMDKAFSSLDRMMNV